MLVSLDVAADDLRGALGSLARAVPARRREEAVLSYDGACLHIELGGASMAIPAAGTCDVQIRVAGAVLLKMRSVLPRGPRLALSASGGQFMIERCAIRCTLQPAWSKAIDLPANTAPLAALKSLAAESPEDLAAAGLLGYFAAHREELRRKAMRLRGKGNDISRIEDLLGPLPGDQQLNFLALLGQ